MKKHESRNIKIGTLDVEIIGPDSITRHIENELRKDSKATMLVRIASERRKKELKKGGFVH